jgi:hypothetical protein
MAARNTQCPKAKGETIVQNGSFRVYQRIKHQPKKYYTTLTSVYSCALNKVHFKRHLIGSWGNNLDGTLTVTDGQLAGSFALLRVEDETGVAFSEGLLTSDLRKDGARSFYPANDQALGESWIASGGGILVVYSPNSTNASLHAIDSAGDHALATGAFTEPGVSSSHAFWLEAGLPKLFEFAGAAFAPTN